MRNVLQKSILCLPEWNYRKGWDEDTDKNLKRIILAVIHIRARNAGDDERVRKLEQDALKLGYVADDIEIDGLNYKRLALYEPYSIYELVENEWRMMPNMPTKIDEEKHRYGHDLIIQELIWQFVKQKNKVGEPPLTLSLMMLILDLIMRKFGGELPLSSVCLGEIALVFFVNFRKVWDSRGKSDEYESMVVRICSDLSIERADIENMFARLSSKPLLLYEKVVIIRHWLKNQPRKTKMQEPTYSHAENSEKVVKIILGEEQFNNHVVPIIQHAAYLLATTSYFALDDEAKNQHLIIIKAHDKLTSVVERFEVRIVQPIVRRRMKGGLHTVRSLIDKAFEWNVISSICSKLYEPRWRGPDVPDKTLKPRGAPDAPPAEVLAEIISAELLDQLSNPAISVWHNCYFGKNDEKSIRYSPPERPDAGTIYDCGDGNGFTVTFEPSMFDDKGKLDPERKIRTTNIGRKCGKDGKVKARINDITAAIDHANKTANYLDRLYKKADKLRLAEDENYIPDVRPTYAKCRKFAFLVHKELPSTGKQGQKKDKESLKVILEAAASESDPTVIPMDFRELSTFMNILREIIKKDGYEMTPQELLRILIGIENELILLYRMSLEENGDTKNLNINEKTLKKIMSGDIRALSRHLFSHKMLEKYYKEDKPQSPGEEDGQDGHDVSDNAENECDDENKKLVASEICA